MVLDYPLTLAPRWTPIVVNSMKKSHQYQLDVWSKLIRQPISKWIAIKHKQKQKTTREKKREHKRIC